MNVVTIHDFRSDRKGDFADAAALNTPKTCSRYLFLLRPHPMAMAVMLFFIGLINVNL